MKRLSSSHQRSMAFDQAIIPHTLSGKYTLEHPPLEGGFSPLFCIAKTGNKAALTPVSGPQRKREEVISNFGTYPAVTHYLIISHLLVAKEKEIKEYVQSHKYIH